MLQFRKAQNKSSKSFVGQNCLMTTTCKAGIYVHASMGDNPGPLGMCWTGSRAMPLCTKIFSAGIVIFATWSATDILWKHWICQKPPEAACARRHRCRHLRTDISSVELVYGVNFQALQPHFSYPACHNLQFQKKRVALALCPWRWALPRHNFHFVGNVAEGQTLDIR